MARQNPKGRPGGERHVRLAEWLLASAAYRSLGPYARALYVELKRRYNGTNNGDVQLSYREAETLLGCSNKPVPAAFRELEERGFIKASVRGSFNWKSKADASASRATTWILTEYPQDVPIRHLTTTKDFMNWKPEATTKKSRPAESVPMARSKRAIDEDMARPKRTNGTPKACDTGHFSPDNGTLKACTYNIPDTQAVFGLVPPEDPSQLAVWLRRVCTDPHDVERAIRLHRQGKLTPDMIRRFAQ